MATSVSGIDVSHYQKSVDWGKVKAAGVAFAFAKATEGVSVSDAMFATNWSGMKTAGLLRGAYHFFRPTQDAAAQAKFFLQKVTLSSGDLPPVLDVETADGASSAAIQAGVQTWLDTVSAQTGVTPMIYASPGFWNGNLSGDFSRYPLWIAQYGVSAPRLPEGWSNWHFWQYSQSGQVDGVPATVDLDYFQGSMDNLIAFAGGASTLAAAAAVVPPAPGSSTQTYTVQPGDSLGGIAAKFGVSVSAVASANGIQNPNLIQAGQTLRIPQGE